MKECSDPPKKIIPGFNVLSIKKNLTVSQKRRENARSWLRDIYGIGVN
jgi:hypothetical protein